ncbi:hypothetical protein [Roseibium sp. TrichSKD4]|uniref:hypothetical protein n=1 Tax=Roseibium sp. TrichSKD4 TaxID=744980 RepID=UPI00058B9DFD|nr:hypothetical protein [Roseibium sp. TrichSKD4]
MKTEESLSIKIKRHQTAYLSAIADGAVSDWAEEETALMAVILHEPRDPAELNQRLIYIAGYLIASKGRLTPEEMEYLCARSLFVTGH